MKCEQCANPNLKGIHTCGRERASPMVESFWRRVIEWGPMGLTNHDWLEVERHLPEAGRVILKRFLSQLAEQSRWIVEREEAMRGEADRIEQIGKTMKRAGLRSYTDKDGRIFVADDG